MPEVVWQQCIDRLQDELPSQQFNTWIRPLQASSNGQSLTLFAPNRFIKDFVSDKFAERISELVREIGPSSPMNVVLEIGSAASAARRGTRSTEPRVAAQPAAGFSRRYPGVRSRAWTAIGLRAREAGAAAAEVEGSLQHQHHLVDNYTLTILSRASPTSWPWRRRARWRKTPGIPTTRSSCTVVSVSVKRISCTPWATRCKAQNPDARVVYLHSERFVADMVKALQLNAISDFKRYYRSVDALLIDDIQFLPRKTAPRRNFSTPSMPCWKAANR